MSPVEFLIDEILFKNEVYFDDEGNFIDEPRIEYINKYRSSFNLSEYVTKALEMENNTSKVNRVEVIQHSSPYNGRAYTNYNASEVEIQYQDDGKTLKIFLK